MIEAHTVPVVVPLEVADTDPFADRMHPESMQHCCWLGLFHLLHMAMNRILCRRHRDISRHRRHRILRHVQISYSARDIVVNWVRRQHTATVFVSLFPPLPVIMRVGCSGTQPRRGKFLQTTSTAILLTPTASSPIVGVG